MKFSAVYAGLALSGICEATLQNSTNVTLAEEKNQMQYFEVSSFNELKYYLTGAKNVELLVTKQIDYDEDLEAVQSGEQVVIRADPNYSEEYIPFVTRASQNVPRRHFAVDGGELTLVGLELTDAYRHGEDQSEHFGGSVRVGFNVQGGTFRAIRCRFAANHAHQSNNNGYSGGRGGAIFVRGSTLILESVIFEKNECYAPGNANDGGIVQPGGGQDLYADEDSTVILRNSMFKGGGKGDYEWTRFSFDQVSEPHNCIYSDACYGEASKLFWDSALVSSGSCVDSTNEGLDWGVKCECNAGYVLDELSGTCEGSAQTTAPTYSMTSPPPMGNPTYPPTSPPPMGGPTYPPSTGYPNAICMHDGDCMNDGYCSGNIDMGEGFCYCVNDYSGDNCEIAPGGGGGGNTCYDHSQCGNHGYCNNGYCACDAGYCREGCEYYCGTRCDELC